jgi:hypothetical protein
VKFSEAKALKHEIAPYYVSYTQWRDKNERAMKTGEPVVPAEHAVPAGANSSTFTMAVYKEKAKQLLDAVRRDWQFGELRVTIIDKAPPQMGELSTAFIVTLPGGGDFQINDAHQISQMRHELYRIDLAHAEFERWVHGEVDALPAEPNC